MLALRTRGLGSCLDHPAPRARNRRPRAPRHPRPRDQAGLFPVAYTKGTDFKPASRGPVERITYFNEWKATGEVPPAD